MANKQHPELRDGEIFLENCYSHYDRIGWQSKRAGQQAYDNSGNAISAALCFPVFVRESELVDAGVSTDF